MHPNKIILGTAQFRMKYGLKKNRPKTNSEIEEILKYIKQNRFFGIDTSQTYADTEKILGKKDLKNIKIISKFIIKENQITQNTVNKTLKNLKVNSIYAFMFHDENQILSNKGSFIFDELKVFKKKRIINKIGVSVYNPEKAIEIINKFDIDIIQIPVSIFDRRFLNQRFINLINKKNIIVHGRSIFLQGLLINDKIKNPNFKDYYKKINDWHNWILDNSLNPISECIKFIHGYNFIKKLIIGVDNINDLISITDIIKKPFSEINIPQKFNYNKMPKLINPTFWKK